MKPSPSDLLLDAALPSAAFAASLAATRQAARHRRFRRRLVRASVVPVGLLALLWWYLTPSSSLPPPVQAVVQRAKSDTVVQHAFVRVVSQPSISTVKTQPAPYLVVQTTRKVDHVATTVVTPRITTEELFALAGPRPMALHYLPNGEARWLPIPASP